ncbi:DUF2974 domain-containing protein [Desulfococcaceae bacterium HSG7]|nr:DUF2974 domain-containing protein [Desulfococcaceae bacterium HSG7]
MHTLKRLLGSLFIFVFVISINSVCLSTDESVGDENNNLNAVLIASKKCKGVIDKNTIKAAHETVDYSKLAANVYDHSVKIGDPVKGVKSSYIKIEDMIDDKTGFHASVYQEDKDSGKIIIAFEGTTDIVDWINNMQNILRPMAKQYAQAGKFTGKIIQKYGRKRVVVVGHSLGGGQSDYVAICYNVPAYTFNSANVSKTASSCSLVNNDKRNKIVHVVNKGEPISIANVLTNNIAKLTDKFGNLTNNNYFNNIPYLKNIVNPLARVGTLGKEKFGEIREVNFYSDRKVVDSILEIYLDQYSGETYSALLRYIDKHSASLMANFLKCVVENYPLPDDDSTDQVADSAGIDDPTDRSAGTLLPESEYVIGQHIKQLPGILLPKPESLPVVKPLSKIKPLPEAKPLPHVKPLSKPQQLPW